jgi:hypothetical protein
MNIGSVMDELGVALKTITGIRVFPYSANQLTAPAAVVGWPESYTYDDTMGRGKDHGVFPVFIVVGAMSARTARANLSKYSDGAGTSSVKVAIESHTYTSCESVRVQSCEFNPITVGGTEYLGATFQVDVIGSGS